MEARLLPSNSNFMQFLYPLLSAVSKTRSLGQKSLMRPIFFEILCEPERKIGESKPTFHDLPCPHDAPLSPVKPPKKNRRQFFQRSAELPDSSNLAAASYAGKAAVAPSAKAKISGQLGSSNSISDHLRISKQAVSNVASIFLRKF